MKFKWLTVGIFILLVLQISPLAYAKEEVNVWFFYATWCPHCHKVLSSGVLDSLGENVTVTKFVIDRDPSAREKFMEIVNHYKIPAGVPTVVVFEKDPLQGKILQGDDPIIEGLPSLVKGIETQLKKGEITMVKRDVWKDLILVAGTAAADSINPCIISVLALLILALTSMKSYKRILKLSFFYTMIVYVSYLIIGILIALGAMVLVNQVAVFSSITWIIKLVVAILLVFAGVINIKDFFWYGKGFSFSLPPKYKTIVMKLAKRASIPAILLLGLIVTIVEFPCSGIMYLGLITYFISQAINPWLLFEYLIIYNFIFIIPLLIIIFSVSTGKKISEIENVRTKYRRVFRLIMGMVLLLLAILILVI